MDKEDDEGKDLDTVSFEVIQDQIEVLQKRFVFRCCLVIVTVHCNLSLKSLMP